MDTSTKRADMISGLRALADALEAHPEMPTPYSVDMEVFWRHNDAGDLDGHVTQAEARAAMAAAPGDWSKDMCGNYVAYRKAFGQHVNFMVNVQRSEVCTKVQTGTRHVPAQPERDEPVYEWVCGDTDADAADAAN